MHDINDHEWIREHCYFCEAKLKFENEKDYGPQFYAEEVGELWSEEMENTVLAHVDCIPDGTIEGTNKDWSMA